MRTCATERWNLRVVQNRARRGQKARMLAAGKGLSFSESGPPCRLTLLANAAALERLLLLCGQRVKYTPPSGHVALVLSVQGSQAVIEVRDTGIGIAEQDLPHVFERFIARIKPAPARPAAPASGFQSPKWIAETHNGSIELRSRPGQGTTVLSASHHKRDWRQCVRTS